MSAVPMRDDIATAETEDELEAMDDAAEENEQHERAAKAVETD